MLVRLSNSKMKEPPIFRFTTKNTHVSHKRGGGEFEYDFYHGQCVHFKFYDLISKEVVTNVIQSQ